MRILLAALLCLVFFSASTQTSWKFIRKAGEEIQFVDYDAFEKLTATVKEYRKTHLLSVDSFIRMSKQKKTIILDTRSDSMYNAKHLKGAIHINFSDFNQEVLSERIPDLNTRILIYCNNNFYDDPVFFVTKVALPRIPRTFDEKKPTTLALNIPTYINLYGYGYRNVYELRDVLSVSDPRIEFEGTSVRKRR